MKQKAFYLIIVNLATSVIMLSSSRCRREYKEKDSHILLSRLMISGGGMWIMGGM